MYLLLPALIVLAAVLRRVPVLGRLVSLAMWLGMAGLLVIVLGQRQQFDPYLARVAGYLKLEGQEVVGKEMRIRMAADGHFWARATIDGVERRMLVDSGATLTALSPRTAAAAGLDVREPMFPLLLRTANGTVKARTAKVTDLRLGNIAARDLAVVVTPGLGETDVLGMNFLSKLRSWRVEEGTLILVPHRPQPVAPA